MKSKLSIFLFIFFPFLLQSQNYTPKKWEFSGYQKSVQGLLIIENPFTQKDTLLTNIFLHNRLNFKWFPNEHFTFRAELRSRFFFGSFHRSVFAPGFKENLKEDSNDFLNLQWINVGNQVVFQSVFDRLYLEYEKGDWEVTLGRQRINWGISSLWNPHDIFNTFSFLDFDYEERPGVDALHITKYIGYSGGIEFAVKAASSLDDFVGAFLYKMNKWNYDFQWLAGYAKQDVVLGIGWAGAIKNAGFKGEMSYFIPTKSSRTHSFTGVLEFNYAFKKGTLIDGALLYNSTDNSNTNLFDFELEARNLYPYHWAIAPSVIHPFTPLLQGSLSVVYTPMKGHPLFISPMITYSITENFDADLIGQFFLEGQPNRYKATAKLIFLRVKWSF